MSKPPADPTPDPLDPALGTALTLLQRLVGDRVVGVGEDISPEGQVLVVVSFASGARLGIPIGEEGLMLLLPEMRQGAAN